MTQYDPDSLFGHGIRIKELEDRLSGSEKITANKLTELEQKIEHIEEYYIEEGVGERIEKLKGYQEDQLTHTNAVQEQILELQKSIDHLKECNIADTKSIEELRNKLKELELLVRNQPTGIQLRERIEKLEDGENFLNPHLQCDGECYRCEDNIPSHGNAPNQCGRQQSKEPKPSRDIDYEQCKECDWYISFGCSQQERRPEIGYNCPTFKSNEKPSEPKFIYKGDIGLSTIIQDVRKDQKQKDVAKFLKIWKKVGNFIEDSKEAWGYWDEIDNNLREKWQKELEK